MSNLIFPRFVTKTFNLFVYGTRKKSKHPLWIKACDRVIDMIYSDSLDCIEFTEPLPPTLAIPNSFIDRFCCIVSQVRSENTATEWRAACDQIIDDFHNHDSIVGIDVHNLNDYQEKAMRTADDADLTVAALGLCGESGEVADMVKKNIAQGHDLYFEELVEELGDVLWYLALATTSLGITLDYVADCNIKKLEARYPNGFEVERSINREDAA